MNEREAALLEELTRLRKGRGVTPGRIAVSELLRRVLGPEPRPDLRFREFVDSLDSSDHSNALRHAYGYGTGLARTLTQRRADFAALCDVHPDTVENWENEALQDLLHVLAGGLGDAGSPEQPTERPERGFIGELYEWVVDEGQVADLQSDIEWSERQGYDAEAMRFFGPLGFPEDFPTQPGAYLDHLLHILDDPVAGTGANDDTKEVVRQFAQLMFRSLSNTQQRSALFARMAALDDCAEQIEAFLQGDGT